MKLNTHLTECLVNREKGKFSDHDLWSCEQVDLLPGNACTGTSAKTCPPMQFGNRSEERDEDQAGVRGKKIA